MDAGSRKTFNFVIKVRQRRIHTPVVDNNRILVKPVIHADFQIDDL